MPENADPLARRSESRDRSRYQGFAAGGPVEFERDRIDLAVRRDDFPIGNGVFVEPLAEEAVGPVVAPALLTDNAIADMRRVPELHSMTRPGAWKNWSSRSGYKRLRPQKLYYEHFYLALQAAQAGQGAALASVYMAASDIAAGLLVAPRRFTPDGTRYVCLSAGPIEADKRKEIFVSWLAERMAALARDFVSEDC
jgi:DNA-binding transcriptional LysR family regulator